MKRKILSLVLCLAMMVSLAACGGSSEEQAPASDTDSSAEQIVIKISHQNAITHPTQKGLEKFKELLEERSGGTMTCDIYDSAVLGNDTSNLQQVIAGSLDAAMIMGADIWQGYDKRAMIENLPFMFSTYEEARAAWDGEFGQYGRIVNLASMNSFVAGPKMAAYVASKGGIAQVTKAFANEWGGRGIRVNAIAPGYIETDQTLPLQQDPKRYQEILDRIAVGRWGKPDDLVGPVLMLCSEAGSYCNGLVMPIDGGYLAR